MPTLIQADARAFCAREVGAERVKRPLRAYAQIEAGVCVAGLLVPTLVARLRAARGVSDGGGRRRADVRRRGAVRKGEVGA
jgi:hypothetical protein